MTDPTHDAMDQELDHELAQDPDHDPADDAQPVDAELAAFDAEIDALDLDVDVDEFADEIPEPKPAEPGPVGNGPSFYDAGDDRHALDDLTLDGRPPVLERLGPAHFRSKGFSFMGFLQTVYDHVATEMTTAAPHAVVTAADAIAVEPPAPEHIADAPHVPEPPAGDAPA